MASLLEHMEMVSLRGKGYAFNLEGEIPDWRDEPSRQLYMDSFILFALPVDPEAVGEYRVKGMKAVLEVLTRLRVQWLPSAPFSIRVDYKMWGLIFEAYMPAGQPKPKFPWKVPEFSIQRARGLPSFIYEAWRTGMGLTCGYPSFKDETSTEVTLSNVSKMTTEERVRSFLKYERLEQWCTTRGIVPVKQTQPVQSEENAQWPPKLCHWPAFQEGDQVQAVVAKSASPPKEIPLLGPPSPSSSSSPSPPPPEPTDAEKAAKKKQQEEKKKKREETRARRLQEEEDQETERLIHKNAPGLRALPCERCLNSALSGQSVGRCWDRLDEEGNLLGGRYERCANGGKCCPIPLGAVPAALFFLDYIQETKDLALPANNPKRSKRQVETNKRRIGAKVALAGAHEGTYPCVGDSRVSRLP